MSNIGSQHRAYTYKLVVPPSTTPVGLETFKKHIKRKVSNNSEDDLLLMYLQAATSYAENLMRRDLISRTYDTYRDFFPSGIRNEGYYLSTSGGFEIRKSPLQSVTSIQYYVSGILTPLDSSLYYNTVEDDYSEILTLPDKCWPSDGDQRLQSIVIRVVVGFGDNEKLIPSEFKTAILAHATALWANRGDCSSNTCKETLPGASKQIYYQNRIENL